MVVASDGFSTVSSPPLGVWFLSGKHRNDVKCLNSLFRLYSVELPTTPDTKWSVMMSSLMSGSIPPWSQVMPSGPYKNFVKNLINTVVKNIDLIPKNYYDDVWFKCNSVFTSLRQAKVDGPLFRSSSAADSNNGALETFKPGPGGFLPVVEYDRFGTRTGRLVVKSGPSILTLKKDYRTLLRSSYQGGTICSLDFGALEARIILGENGVSPPIDDLYARLSADLFDGKVPRNTVKVAVLSELYGASRSALTARLGMSGSELDSFISTVRSYFGIPLLKYRLKKQYDDQGSLQNKFGRKLRIDNPQDNILVNTFAQSTGVDVSLLGFSKVLNDLGSDGIRPLFVLHDALILDVKEDRMKDVESILSVSVPGYESEFPLKLERIYSHDK